MHYYTDFIQADLEREEGPMTIPEKLREVFATNGHTDLGRYKNEYHQPKAAYASTKAQCLSNGEAHFQRG